LKASVVATLILIGLLTGVSAPASAETGVDCPVEASKAIDEARKILAQDDQSKLGIALSCLTLALARTQAELDGLREGRVAFSGQIFAPKGFIMSKPSVQEGR